MTDDGGTQRLSTEGADQLSLAGVNDANLNELARITGSRVSLRGDVLTVAAATQGTVRAVWGAREHGQRDAVRLGYAYVAMGTSQDSIAEGQKFFESGKRIEWRLR